MKVTAAILARFRWPLAAGRRPNPDRIGADTDTGLHRRPILGRTEMWPWNNRMMIGLSLILPGLVACPLVVEEVGNPRVSAVNKPVPRATATEFKISATPAVGTPAPGGTAATPPSAVNTSPAAAGGLDSNTERGYTPAPLSKATSPPTPLPKSYGSTVGQPVGLAGEPGALAFSAPGKGWVALPALGQLGEFSARDLSGNAFTNPAGVTDPGDLAPDGAGGLWVISSSARQLVRLGGSPLTPDASFSLPFIPVRLAADSVRTWVASGGTAGFTCTGGATASLNFSETPVNMVADGSGGVWTAAASGTVRSYTMPGSPPGAPVDLGAPVMDLARGDAGGVWILLGGATPKVRQHSETESQTIGLPTGERAIALAPRSAGSTWVLTAEALYLIETTPGGTLTGLRYPREESETSWEASDLIADPGDTRKIYAADRAGKAIRRLYTGQ